METRPETHQARVDLISRADRDYRAAQDPEEFALLLDFVGDRPLRRVLEIGTYRAGTTWVLAQLATSDAIVVSVDNGPQGQPGLTAEEIANAEQSVHLIRADSREAATVAEVKDLFRGEPVDFLLIDGDHTYDGARADWENYSPLVRPRGVVAFHDIQNWAPERGGCWAIEVWGLWEELRERFPGAVEFCRPDSAGIGAIELGSVRD